MEDRLPKVTKDGVTIVKNIYREDPLEEIACGVLRQAAHNSNVYCGDGTTTSTIIAASIFRLGQKMIAGGANPIGLKRGIDRGRAVLIEYLNDIRKPIEGMEMLRQCARVDRDDSRWLPTTTTSSRG